MNIAHFTRVQLVLMLLAVCALAACGGGGNGGSIAPVVTAKASAPGAAVATTTMTFQVEIPIAPTAPVPQRATTDATQRTPQYLAPQTSFILVDLQNNGNPIFDNTFTVTPTTCPASGGFEQCSFSGVAPNTDPSTQQWSILAGAGKSDGSLGAPLSVQHKVVPCYPFPCQAGTINLNVYLNTIVADIFHAGLGWSGNDYPQAQPPFPDFMLTPMDAFGNTVRGTYGNDAPINSAGFENPFTLSIDDPTGEVTLEPLIWLIGPYPVPGPPFTSQVLSTLAGEHGGIAGIEIVNAATSPHSFQINYTVPEVDLQPSEFPQLAKTFVSPAKAGTIMTVTCNPPSTPPKYTDCTETGQ